MNRISRLAIVFLSAFLLTGFSSVPPSDMSCGKVTGEDDGVYFTDDRVYPSSSYWYYRCEFPPIISKFVRPDSIYSQYVTILIPKIGSKMRLRFHFDGYNARPDVSWPNAIANTVVVRVFPDHTPDATLYQSANGTGSWGGPVNGENPLGWRVAASMKWVTENFGSMIDFSKGIQLEGCSYGGSTSILQSLLIPDAWAKALVTEVSACVPPTLMVKQSAPIGNYWRDPAIRDSWGAFDWTLADVRAKSNERIYYRINGSPSDTSVVFDLAFFPEVCDDSPCFGTWHDGGHNIGEAGVNLPFSEMYSGPDSYVGINTMQPIFFNSTANLFGPRGHFNLGLEWDSSRIIDTVTTAIMPIRYRHRTGLGKDIPDQPEQATFDVALVKFNRFKFRKGESLNWKVGSQEGTAEAYDNGKIRIEDVTLSSSTVYTDLRIWK